VEKLVREPITHPEVKYPFERINMDVSVLIHGPSDKEASFWAQVPCFLPLVRVLVPIPVFILKNILMPPNIPHRVQRSPA
jgi:hypothetical protein